MLYFADIDCSYCLKLEKEVLMPMLRGGDYEQRVLLGKIDWRSADVVEDLDNTSLEQRLLSERYGVTVTPTLVFIGPDGREVAERILGFRSADFFWYYLDQRINSSRVELER